MSLLEVTLLRLRPRTESEGSFLGPQRSATFSTFWKTFESRFNNIVDASNRAQFEELVSFGRRRATQTTTPYFEIPTALFLIGVNVPDHDTLFRELARHFRSELSPHVVQLFSKDCVHLQELMRALMASVMGSRSVDDDGNEVATQQQTARLPLCTMEVLAAWYEAEHATPASNKSAKKKLSSRKRTAQHEDAPDAANITEKPPIVVILRDFEAFDAQTLSDFIEVCSNNKGRPPILLVLGIASSSSVVYRKLPRQALTMLNMERFGAVRQVNTFESIVRELLLANSAQYKLLSKPIAAALSGFASKNLSLMKLRQAIKLTTLEHFMHVPSRFVWFIDWHYSG